MDFPTLHDEAFGYDEIYLHLEDVSVDLPDQEKLVSVIKQMATEENAPLRELNYVFCSDDYLLEMNRTHLQHDYYTDVITFAHLEQTICGDIYISTTRVTENAQNAKVPFEHELLRVMLHGALHLAGFGDKTDDEKTLMRSKEDQYLSLWSQA
jgi:probable rRNA maturation factor